MASIHRAALVSLLLALTYSAAHADISISNQPTQNMDCQASVCTATAQKAVLNVGELRTLLASGDVAVKTGRVAKDIAIDQPLTWSSNSRLTLDAQRSITVKKQVTVAGQGALTITTNDSGTPKKNDGEFIIVPEHGSVQFWDLSSRLIIDGHSYTLVGDIKTLASDIAADPSGFYALAKPYDASADGTYSMPPITTLLQGIVEGLGNKFISLAVHTDNGVSASFIKAIGVNGVFRDLGIVNATISSTPSNGQAILAFNNLGQILRCWVSGRMTFSFSDAGGLANANEGLIASSFADVRMVGQESKEVGGLVGFQADTGKIASSYTRHSVVLRFSDSSSVGGLVGENEGSISNSFARNKVGARKKDAGANFGGLVGTNDAGAQIKASYAAGAMTFKSSVQAGGLIGSDGAAPGNIQHSYWDLDMGISDPNQGAGNIDNDPGITGLTDAQLKSGLPPGFDPNIWGSDPNINNGYPFLLANPPQ
jgi:hypothetical protein